VELHAGGDGGAPRSVVVPLATNLHVAFDVKTLRMAHGMVGTETRADGLSIPD